MKKLVDEHSLRHKLLDGILKVDREVDGEWVPHSEEEFNLVVFQASDILRDIMFGGTDIIDKIQFGDMSLDPLVDDLRNVAPPLVTDTSLTNKLYEKVVSKTSEMYGTHPAIKYEVTLARDEFNGNGEQLITEFSLATVSGRIFTRKTRASIYKDNETSFRFTWWLIFNNSWLL